MRPYLGFMGTSAELRAASAIDVALWDILGQASGQPLHVLLGGRTRDAVPVYNTCAGPEYVSRFSDVLPDNFGLDSPAQQAGRVYDDLNGFMTRPAEVAAELLDMGIGAMKIWPFDFAPSALHGGDITPQEIRKALQPYEAIHAAHGEKMRIKTELHGIWSLTAAKKICAALESVETVWVEDPIWMDRSAELAELGCSTRLMLAGGETLGGLGQIRDLIQSGRIGVPIVDVTWGGGVTFAKKVAALAEAFAKPIAFHDCSGPVTLAVSTHLALACPNVVEQEMTRAFYYGWYAECVDKLPPVQDGLITAPDGPGLGIGLAQGLTERPDAIVRTTSH